MNLHPKLSNRLYQVDLARGLACLSMPIYHAVYNLFTVGLVDSQLTRNLFWNVYQTLGLGTFVFVSGMAFVLSTSNGIRWSRLSRRIVKLGAVAGLISLLSWWFFPDRFVRFGVLHFFTTVLLLAPLFRLFKYWAAALGLSIIGVAVYVGYNGAFNNAWLYPTGLMSQRPASMDYIPLIPWFGVFLLGLTVGHALPAQSRSGPLPWMRPVIWLGQHSLAFYLIHQAVVYAVLVAVAWLVSALTN